MAHVVEHEDARWQAGTVLDDGEGGVGAVEAEPSWGGRSSQPPEPTTATTRVAYLATTGSTAGEFGLYRWVMDEQRSGPDPHFHRTMSESFLVLSGTVRLYDGQRWIDAIAGDFLYVPAGGIHGFRNESGAPAEMLLLFAPGAPRETYFEGLAAIAASGHTPTDQEHTQFLRRHDQYML